MSAPRVVEDFEVCPKGDPFCAVPQGQPHDECETWDDDAPVTDSPLSPELKARASIADIENAADRLSYALNRVTELEDARAIVKGEAIRRLVESGAYTSVTSAEKYVEADSIYMAHRLAQRDAEIEKHRAMAGYQASLLAAKLDVALVEAAGGDV